MEIEKLEVGQLQTNCYLVWDKDTKESIIVDPGDDGDYILRRLHDLRLLPKSIVATHGHFDHVLAATELKLALSIPFWAPKRDLALLKRTQESARYWLGIEVDPPPKIDKYIKNGEVIKFGQEKLKVIFTPGHSPGGVVLYDKGVLFSGDTLFYEGVGRTDLSYASPEDLEKSLKRILRLPTETVVYPGHGSETTIGEAKKFLESSLYWKISERK